MLPPERRLGDVLALIEGRRFFQRVINGGGRIEREYGLGRGALDLMIEWRGQRHAIEVKLRRDTETEAEA